MNFNVGRFITDAAHEAHPIDHRNIQHQVAGLHRPFAIITAVENLDIVAPIEPEPRLYSWRTVGRDRKQAQVGVAQELVGVVVVTSAPAIIELALGERSAGKAVEQAPLELALLLLPI